MEDGYLSLLHALSGFAIGNQIYGKHRYGRCQSPAGRDVYLRHFTNQEMKKKHVEVRRVSKRQISVPKSGVALRENPMDA